MSSFLHTAQVLVRRKRSLLFLPAAGLLVLTALLAFPGRSSGKLPGRSPSPDDFWFDNPFADSRADTTFDAQEKKEDELSPPGGFPVQKGSPGAFRERGGKAPGDSLGAIGDSTGLASDTMYVVFLDSTARLAHFNPRRIDEPAVQLFPDRTYPLFAKSKGTSPRREVVLDSTGSSVRVRERVGTADVRVPLSLPLGDYIRERRRFEMRKMLADEVRKPPLASNRDDLGELITRFTQIQIPIPQNPILSIFGKGGISLSIGGQVDIKAGFRNTTSDQTQLSRLDQSRNEPDFAQDVQVNVSGTIGDKLNILADWNTQRTFEYENQLKIKYTGYDDEIVQSVEAGNVSLQTPSSFVGSSQQLFGIKAQFQAGPLRLTALASQKKGQIKEVSVSGGAQQIPFEIRVSNYSYNNYFVDTTYRRYYEPYYAENPPTVTVEMQNDQIVEEEVWVTRQGTIPDPTERRAIAYIDLDPISQQGYPDSLRTIPSDLPGRIEQGQFIRLARNQYEILRDGYIGVLGLNTNVQEQQIVAIAYRRAGGPQFGELARDFGTDTSRTLVLKMVKPKNLASNGRAYVKAWNQLLKNVYSIGSRNLKQSGFTLDIVREDASTEAQNAILGQPLLRVTGLDRYRADGTAAADGDAAFDFLPGVTVSLTRAEIIFPTLRPFDTGIKQYFADRGLPLDTPDPDSSKLIFPEMYDTTRTFATQNVERNKYIIRGTATGDATSKYSLGFNVVEGSVEVLLDGSTLVQNIDYTVDYIVGEVVIRNERALVPGANLQIKFEQNDLFQLASKTLLGARGDIALGPKTLFGFTVLNLNQETLSDKVRLGEEPNINTIFGVDGATEFELPFLSRALDALPLLATRELSTMRVSGEAAYMLPDPNTRKSPIPADEGEGIAFIDDFEGSRRTIPLGINYSQWTLSSPPADSISILDQNFTSIDSIKTYSKGKMVWFNRLPTDVRLTDVYPRKQPGKDANDQITVLDLRYLPAERGQFNYSRDVSSTLTPTKNWGGVMKPISVTATNLINENVNFIELWMQVGRIPASQPTFKMVIEMGAISEDVIPTRPPSPPAGFSPDATLQDEDYKISNNPGGILNQGEDVGLDMLTDAEEIGRYGGIPGINPGDPSGDNYTFNNTTVGTASEDFSRINGTENNQNSPGGQVPDGEDLNSNGAVDLLSSYFRYEIPLNTDTLLYRNPYIVGGGNMGWYQFRIPVREFTSKVGSPSLENVEFVRLLFLNAEDTVAVRIADLSLVGNQWQEFRKDSAFSVSVISIEDNPFYESPPGVIRERDKTRPDEQVYANEQSLNLLVNELPGEQRRVAVKYFTFKPLDVFNYRTMKMFVHGDPSFRYVSESDHDADFIFWFGVDTLNYYEYRAPIRQGWDPLNDVVIKFDELTAIKQGRDSTNVLSPPAPVPGGPPGATYRVRGNPSLTQIRFLALGVWNARPDVLGNELTGQVWVNEMRLTSVDDSPGWAYRFDTSLKLADFGSASFNYSRVDPSFHTLEQRFGSRQIVKNWGISTSFQVERLFPADWAGTSLPFSYSHTEGITNPRFLPNSDVVVSEAAGRAAQRVLAAGGSQDDADAAAGDITAESQTYRITDTYAAPTLRFGFPSQQWYIRDTFNKLTFGFNYTTTSERNPAVARSLAWQWAVRMAWGHNFSPEYNTVPFESLFDGIWFFDEFKSWKLFFTPSAISWSIASARSKNTSLQRASGSKETVNRNFTASRQIGFTWKLTEGGLINPTFDYSLQIESSLLSLETDSLGRQRPFSQILDDIFFGSRLMSFGEDTRYGQRVGMNTKPTLPNIFNIKKFLDMNFTYATDYAWQNQLQRGDLGKSAGFTNTMNFSMNFRLKALIDPLFQEGAPTAPATPAPRGRRGAGEGQQTPSTPDTAKDAAPSGAGMGKTLDQLGSIFKTLIKVPFLDYDNINITFNQTNGVQNSGVVGGTGFVNFWGTVPFFQDSDPTAGPSRLYQLGLLSDPSGSPTNVRFVPYPPFVRWDVVPGLRAKGGVLVNSFRQTNKVAVKTSRSLWEGARVDLNWNIGWSYGRTQNVSTDSINGFPTVTNTTTQGAIERSFLTFPDVLFFGVFNTGIKEVGKRYSELRADQGNPLPDEEKLALAFEEGFEAIPIFKSLFGEFYPRINWSLRWDGLERLPLFSGFISRLSLDHTYNSTYTRQFRNLQGVGEQTDGQRVAYGFTPLLGLNFTFKELLKGSLGANLRYTSTTSYDLQTSSRNIVETLSQEIAFTASYSRRGFEIPLFGLALNNDVDVSVSYSVTKNSRRNFEVALLEVSTEGQPLDGTTRTALEPRLKYILSSRVTASVYYRYTKVAPDDAGSRIPGSTINEAGLDIHISIQ